MVCVFTEHLQSRSLAAFFLLQTLCSDEALPDEDSVEPIIEGMRVFVDVKGGLIDQPLDLAPVLPYLLQNTRLAKQ